MNVLVTGSSGFIGKNLVVTLKEKYDNINIFKYDIENTFKELKEYISKADYIFHLAGVNRPLEVEDFYTGNSNLTKKLCDYIEETKRDIPLVVSSSIQAENENDYGKSKKMAEEYIFDYSERTGNKISVYRLPNVFGKWCKPNYNSVVATFCYNIANNLPITINDRKHKMSLVYIDDVIDEFIKVFDSNENMISRFCEISINYTLSLGEIVDLIQSFKDSRRNIMIPNMGAGLTKKLYSTYLSYLNKKDFSYDLKMNVDNRGSFTEFLKSNDRGQISINVSNPDITKGNHWHHTKNEKFLVVSGHGVIRFRNILSKEIIEYFVSGNKLQVVDIPVGYTHNIENLGETDMVTIMWVNEIFDSENPDTIYEEV